MNTWTRTPQEPVGSGFGAKSTAAEVVDGIDLVAQVIEVLPAPHPAGGVDALRGASA